MILLPALLALGLCLGQIGGRSLGFDEAASVTIASQPGAALWNAIAHDGGNMSGYYLLLHLVVSVFGNGLVAARVLSALCAAATVALTGALALRLFGPRVAAVAGTLAAVSLPLVFWGQTARGYAPMIALTAASMLAFVALMEDREPGSATTEGREAGSAMPEGREPGGRFPKAVWIAYALTTALAVYCSFVAVLIVPAQLLWLIGRRSAWTRVLSGLAAAALLCVPLLALALSRGSGQLFWVPRPTAKIEQQALETLTSAALRPSFHATPASLVLLCLSLVLIAGVAVALRTWAAGLMLSWLAVPLVFAWLESLGGQSIFEPRNLLAALPATSVLLALAVSERRVTWRLGVPLLVVVLGLRAEQVVASYGVSPENWKRATSYVVARSLPEDCTVFYPQDARMAFDYYLLHPPAGGAAAGGSLVRAAPAPVLPSAPWADVRPYVESYRSLSPGQLAALPSRCRRVWLVSSHAGQPDGPPASLANLARFRGLRAALGHEYAAVSTTQFGYAARIYVELFARRR